MFFFHLYVFVFFYNGFLKISNDYRSIICNVFVCFFSFFSPNKNLTFPNFNIKTTLLWTTSKLSSRKTCSLHTILNLFLNSVSYFWTNTSRPKIQILLHYKFTPVVMLLDVKKSLIYFLHFDEFQKKSLSRWKWYQLLFLSTDSL